MIKNQFKHLQQMQKLNKSLKYHNKSNAINNIMPGSLKKQVQPVKNPEYLKHEDFSKLVAQFLTLIFNFESSVQAKQLENMKKKCIDSGIGRQQLLQIWDSKLHSEMTKFIKKIETLYAIEQKKLKNINQLSQQQKTRLLRLKNQRIGKLEFDIQEKINKLSQAIGQLFIYIMEQHCWCKCNRTQCQLRYNEKKSKQKIIDFLNQKLKNTPKVNFETENYVFFNCIESEQCFFLSIKNIDNETVKRTEKKQQFKQLQQIINNMQSMHMKDIQRIDCVLTLQTVAKIKQKINIEQMNNYNNINNDEPYN